MGLAGGCGILVWAKAVAEIPPTPFFKMGLRRHKAERGWWGEWSSMQSPACLGQFSGANLPPSLWEGTPAGAASPQTSRGAA